jgi:tRNA G10  N-methylase Trm11
VALWEEGGGQVRGWPSRFDDSLSTSFLAYFCAVRAAPPPFSPSGMRFLAKIAADAYGSAALDELDSLFRDEGLDPRAAYARPPAGHDLRDDPFIVGDAPREVLLRVNARVVLTKEVYELWSDGPDLHACAHALAHSVPASVTAPRFAAAHSWRLNVVTHGHKLSVAEQESVRKHFAGTLRAEGPVRLKDDADVTYAAILDVLGVDDKGAVTTARRCKCPGPVAPTAPVAGEWRSAYACCGVTIERKLCEQASWVCAEGLRGEGERGVEESSTAGVVASSSSSPSPSPSSSPRQSRVRRVFFGVAFPPCARRFVPELELRRRPYLGPTSLDAELALLMANLALCRPGHLSWDPFVGTGSITVAAAKLGATTFGSDIDSRVLVGKMGRNVGTNFDAYGLGMPELLRMDNSRPALRGWGGSGSGADSGIFDSIVTDPPYGVRAGARKSGKSAQLKERAERRRTEQGEGGEQVMEGAAEADAVAEAAAAAPAPESADSAIAPLPTTTTTTTYLDGYSPSTTQLYDADEVMTDLLDVAARTLVLGGRLVYLFPTTIDTVYESLPAHPCLRRVHTSSEALSLVLVRLVVTMEKVAPYDPTQADAYRAAVRASAEAGGFTGGGVRARMGQLYEGWFAARKGAGAAGGGTGASSASSDPATAASAPRAPGPASGPGVIPEAHLESLTSKHSRKAESRMLFRQQRRLDRLAAADAAATADAAAGGQSSAAAVVAGGGGAGGAGAGRPGKVRARSAAEGGQEEGEGLTRRDARLAAAARAAAEGAKLHIGNLPFDPPSGIMTETFRKARETIMGSLDGAAGGERGGK